MPHSSLTVAQSGQPIPRQDGARTQRQRRRQSERTKAEIYALVDARDGYCRLTGKTWNLEHHHILSRGQRGTHTTANVVLLHRECHRDITEKRLTCEGNADGVLTFTHRDGRAFVRPVRVR